MAMFTVTLYDCVNDNAIMREVEAQNEVDAIEDCKDIYPCSIVVQVFRHSIAA